ncbi:hypothetical protein [Rhizobium sp. Nf11,1]|uniref:hypothetical protein n=1 Tax=Rhizobium sp. Nf11,1 TaxID=3404923 RepID=UPI003D32F28A
MESNSRRIGDIGELFFWAQPFQGCRLTLDTLDIKIAVSKVSRLYRFHIVARLKRFGHGD